MQRFGIGVGMNRDRPDAKVPRRPDHPDRDFPAIGDQKLFQHQSRSARTAPAITGSSLSTAKRTLAPATSAFTS